MREFALNMHFLDYNGFNGENGCLNSQRKNWLHNGKGLVGYKSTTLQSSIQKEAEYYMQGR